jgi:hypothetical protein
MPIANRSIMLPLSWLELHRQLSILAAELESLEDNIDSSYASYSKQREALSRKLDRALHERLEMSPLEPPESGANSTASLSDIDKLIAEMADDESFADVSAGDLESSAGPWALDNVLDDCLWNASE